MMRRSIVGSVAACLLPLLLVSAVWSADDEPPLPEGVAPQPVKTRSPADADEPPLPDGVDADEPALPEGADDEPGLPEGVEGAKTDEGEPGLPEGAETKEPEEKEPEETEAAPGKKLPFDITGFWEFRAGLRLQDDPYQRDMSIGETRLQLDFEKTWNKFTFKAVADLVYDPVYGHHSIHAEEGRGWLDLRQANVAFSPLKFMDVKVGRQILTWGTGDLLFINDLFPKDWNAFFIGRDTEYLKAPSDALKMSFFTDLVNVDVVYVTRFDADRFIDGRRISYYNTMLGRLAGRDAIANEIQRDEWFTEDEIAARLYRNIKGYEFALYGYRGYWKSPAGMDPTTGRATFPKLSVWGASVRGPVGKGIGNVEFGYYDSRDDPGGGNPFVANSEFRFLVGYEQEIATDFTAGVQYYLEWMDDYSAYKRMLPAGVPRRDEHRHVITLRLTKLLMNQNLKLSLFAYYSPSDADAYLRPNVSYKIDDHWTVEAGANVFLGNRNTTFFGQFEKNTNVYVAARYGF